MPVDDEQPPSLRPREERNSHGYERLSRSPHPYHRRGLSLTHGNGTVLPKKPSTTLSPISTNPPTTYFDVDHRKRRKSTDSPSDSGTEADDEKGAILLGLPAPAARPRKGLKGSNEPASPLLTPSYLDDDRRKAAWEEQSRRKAVLQSQNADEEAAKIREKFVKRRRAELIRRLSEVSLLLAVSHIAVQRSHLLAWTDIMGRPKISLGLQHQFNDRELALTAYATVVLSLYALYPLRIINHNHSRNAANNRSRFYIHLPAAFDPAPLLYPVILPVIVAWSVSETNSRSLFLNIILGIASIPSKIIPMGDTYWYSSPQWLISVFPAVMSQRWKLESPAQSADVWPDRAETEMLSLLYPFHMALLPVLQYLTTTSLLPAELELLSAAMINLFLSAHSPQAIVLKAVLWIGGVLLLIACIKVLQWGVALARIPSWRFRRAAFSSQRRVGILAMTVNSLMGYLRLAGLKSAEVDSSDDEEDSNLKTKIRRSSKPLHKINTAGLDAVSPSKTCSNPRSPTWGMGRGKAAEAPVTNAVSKQTMVADSRLRSHTMPTYMSSVPVESFEARVRSGRSNTQGRSWSFRSLTTSQATILRSAFATYAYVTVIAIIVLPVRIYVSRLALFDKEPIGWALSYLFGDLGPFQHFVQYWDLSSWIPLSVNGPDHIHGADRVGRIDMFRRLFGPANVRLAICGYCVAIILAGLAVVFRLSTVAEVDTRRKVFHGMMVAMFLPTVFVDPAFISLALTLVLAVFLMLDLFRASQLPPIAKPLTYFLAPYVDGRDHRGPVIVSHIFLLIGCAIPVWLSLSAVSRDGAYPHEGWEVMKKDISMVSGVVCVGMGDAAASLIGRRYGRRRWCWSGGKSLEGSLAFAVAVVLGLSAARLWLLFGGWEGDSGDGWMTFVAKATIAGSGASLTEAVLTGGNDNVIVPVVLWLLVRGLGM